MNTHEKDLFSRQIGAVGKATMEKLMNLNVLVIGCNAISMECIKCLSLLGINNLYIYDNTKLSNKNRDEFYITGSKGSKLSELLMNFAKTLNPSLNIEAVDKILELLSNSNKIHCIIQTKPELFSIKKIDKHCIDNNIKYILCSNHELYGYIFSNFGKHIVTDRDGETCESGFLEDIKYNDSEIDITIEKIGKNLISSKGLLINKDGDKIEIDIKNSSLTNIVVNSSEKLVDYLNTKNKNIKFLEIKEALTINHKCFEEKKEEYSYEYITVDSTFEKPNDNDLYNRYMKFLIDLSEKKDSNEFFHKDTGFFILGGIIGGIAAHEVIKVTGKYTPINQEIMFDFSKFRGKSLYKSINNRHSGFLDREIIKKIKSLDIFMVGCGALGCELSKNLGMLDACTSVNSMLTITDMDTIELSNLNRQFLFRGDNIGEHKSNAVKSRLAEYFPKMNVKSFNYEVGKNTENIFNTKFWNNNRLIINALDNVSARQYVDSKCVLHNKPLFESGTLGTKCNTQSIIPNKTATYSEITDEVETSIPMCTIKNFPNKIEHCVEWALELFNNVITTGISDMDKFINKKSELKNELEKLGNDYLLTTRINNLMLYIDLKRKKKFSNFMKFIHTIYEYNFKYPILDILTSFPDDLLDQYGNKFWSGKKLKPSIIEFSEIPKEFVKSFYNVIKESFKLDEWNESEYNKYITNNSLTIERKTKTKVNIDEKHDKIEIEISEESVLNAWKAFSSVLFRVKSKINNIVYDKDDNTLLKLMSSFANMRAVIYGIDVVDTLDIKLISGKIIPALSTTTTVIAGFVMVDILRYLMNLKSTDTNINLGTNQYTIFESMKPTTTYNNMYSNIYSMNIKTIPDYFNTWTKIMISITKDGCSDLSEILTILESDYNIKPNMLTCGNNIIYNSGMKLENKLLEEIYNGLDKCIEEILEINICILDDDGIPILTPKLVLNY